jgi:hypothetical protein
MQKENLQGTSIGYAINLIMDYGNGRQVTISGTLPLGADLATMNAELDKLRLATNRQAALVQIKDVEATVLMAKKTVVATEAMIKAYESEMEKELARVSDSPTAKHTITKAQVENMRSQAVNYKLSKNEELMRAQADVEKGEVLIARLKAETGA